MRTAFLIVVFLITSLQTFAQNTTVSEGVIFDGEPFMAVNPEDNNHLIIAWMGFTSVVQRTQIKTRSSFDGGDTWGPIVAINHVNSGYTSADPSIAFDENGAIVIAFIDSTGVDSDPIEGGIFISKSTDNGSTFGTPIEVLNIDVSPTQRIIDRPWLQIDRTPGANNGTIYITSMNVKESDPPYRPYVSVSTDGGSSFELKIIDNSGWLSGLIMQPMATPALSGTGVFYAAYPSFLPTQNVFPQYIIASSTSAANVFSYNTILASNTTGTNSDPLPKKGYLLIHNPNNENHLAFLFLSNQNEDLDVYFMETLDAGDSWLEPIRVNDDPVGNDRMQDLIWADFNEDGDLVIAWRDRRNASENGYETETEIWATFRPNGAISFEPNFQITNQSVPYNDILAGAGNDFMNVQLNNNIVHCTWGDPRTDILKVWYQKLNTDGSPLGISEITSETKPPFFIYPNPTNSNVTIEMEGKNTIELYNSEGKKLFSKLTSAQLNKTTITLSKYPTGLYFVVIKTNDNQYTHKIIKN